MRRVLKLFLRNKRLLSYLRGIYNETRTVSASFTPPATTIAEAEPLMCRRSNFTQDRLNLLVPALAVQHVFGGISTALAFFSELGGNFPNLRIILTEQPSFSYPENPAFSDWEIRALDDADGPGHLIVPAGNRYAQTLAVGRKDRFIATAWWTAISAKYIQHWQTESYGFDEHAKFVYLIQDYEPGFYPWSSRYALAEATYHDADGMVAVFNTKMLRSFFEAEGYRFPYAYSFEPTLNPALRETIDRARKTPKEKRVLIYGRPGVDRNAFAVIVMALRNWLASHHGMDWTFVSAGEMHPPVELGYGKQLTSLGKLSLAEYSNELARASLGISLMISPHPSYPPLEMAAFGILVITNKYKSKDLSALNGNIVSVASVDPQMLAEKMEQCVRQIEEGRHDHLASKPSTPEWQHYLSNEFTFSSLSERILPLLFLPPQSELPALRRIKTSCNE
jgi:hypothetical protein